MEKDLDGVGVGVWGDMDRVGELGEGVDGEGLYMEGGGVMGIGEVEIRGRGKKWEEDDVIGWKKKGKGKSGGDL